MTQLSFMLILLLLLKSFLMHWKQFFYTWSHYDTHKPRPLLLLPVSCCFNPAAHNQSFTFPSQEIWFFSPIFWGLFMKMRIFPLPSVRKNLIWTFLWSCWLNVTFIADVLLLLLWASEGWKRFSPDVQTVY